jgi:predicted chitinase
VATLKHDSQGFLVGELISGQRELVEFQQSGLAVWKDIRSKVTSIARILGAASPNARTVQPAGRGSGARSTAEASALATTRAAQQPRSVDGRFVTTARSVSPRRARKEPPQEAASTATQVATTAAATTTRSVVASRDGRGRFAGKGTGDGSGDKDAGSGQKSMLANRLNEIKTALRGVAHGAERADPAIAAANEVKQVVAPIGRGLFTVFGRTAEKKKERWYKRLLAAIAGQKSEQPAVKGGVTPSEGMSVGAIAGGVARWLPMLLAGAGTLLAGGLAAFIGTKLGGVIYDWLDKSGIATKIFDAFDALKDWIKEKVEKVKAAYNEYDEARNLARQGLGTKGNEVLDASGRNLNDPRRNDLPSLRDEETTIPQKLGRIIGSAQNGMDYMTGRGGKSRRQIEAERRAVLERQADAAGITDPNERAAFMAQMHHESMGFWAMEERGSGGQYEGRKDLGNTNPGDGERFKGRGFTQLTGRSNYRDMGQRLGLDLESNPELAADPEIAARIATEFWKTRSRASRFGGGRISDLARAGDIDGVTQGINGGMNHADRRRELYRQYLAETGVSSATPVRAGLPGMPSVYAGAPAAVSIPRVPAVSVPSPVPEKLPPSQTVPELSVPEGSKDKPLQVVLREPIGQDVGDRKIAHIVSGGIGF